nr:hypothetical protein [Tanacetum cinerariifolium]
LLGDGASWSTIVEEGEPVDSVGSGAITLARGAITSGTRGSTLGVRESNSSNNGGNNRSYSFLDGGTNGVIEKIEFFLIRVFRFVFVGFLLTFAHCTCRTEMVVFKFKFRKTSNKTLSSQMIDRDKFSTTPRLTATAKGKQPAKAKSPSNPSELARIEAQQLKIMLRRSRQETYISQHGGFGTDEETETDTQEQDRHDDQGDEKDESDDDEEDDDDDKDDNDDDKEEIAKIDVHDDTKRGGDDDEASENDEESDDEETKEEESFDPILRTPEDSEDDGNDEEDQGLRISEEERIHEEQEVDELYHDVDINQGRGLKVSQDIEDSHVTLTPVHPDVQIQTDRLCDSYQRENDEFLGTIDDNIKRIIKEHVKSHVKEQVSWIIPRIEESVNAQLEAEVLTRSSHSSRTSYAVAADLSEMELKKILIEKMEGNKSIQRSNEQRNLYKALVDIYEADKTILDSYGEIAILKRRREDDDDQEGPSARSDQGSTTGSKSRQASASEFVVAEEPMQTTSQIEEPSHPVFETGAEDQPIVQTSQPPKCVQTWISELAKQADSRSFFNELLDTPIDFSNFIMNRLRVDTLTLELLAGPTYELMNGTCKSLTDLEYHLEEVYKATTDQLDWINPEGQQYPHNLLQPILLIPNNRGCRVIPFAHFINNDLEYLRGGAFSRKYTTSITKTKAADYGNIKWIEDLVPRSMWIQEPINYDKHALWGVSYWGRKHQQFYGFDVNRESALDVYSKRRIIAVTDLKIVEWHNYKHLDWISDVYKVYRHPAACGRSSTGSRKLPEEAQPYQARRVPIRSKVTRSIYCLFKPKRIYLSKQGQEKQVDADRLTSKFSDGTLNDVRNALYDRLKGIRMQYLPQTI